MAEEAGEQMWINDEGTVLLIKVHDYIWMWTRSKEQYLMNNRELEGRNNRSQKGSTLYRSNSYDRRSTKLNEVDSYDNRGDPTQLKGSWNKISFPSRVNS